VSGLINEEALKIYEEHEWRERHKWIDEIKKKDKELEEEHSLS